jgi:phosphate transport system protein
VSEGHHRVELRKRDVQINMVEREIRKQVITHLTINKDPGDVPYCLLLMSIVKDVERLGDYAKNLAQIRDDGGAPIPDDANGVELHVIRSAAEATFGVLSEVFATSDSKRAVRLIQEGRKINRRCDELVAKVARSTYDAATTTSMVLGTRYYKRIESHLLNILSGIVMPLHKLDYYDEKVLGATADS